MIPIPFQFLTTSTQTHQAGENFLDRAVKEGLHWSVQVIMDQGETKSIVSNTWKLASFIWAQTRYAGSQTCRWLPSTSLTEINFPDKDMRLSWVPRCHSLLPAYAWKQWKKLQWAPTGGWHWPTGSGMWATPGWRGRTLTEAYTQTEEAICVSGDVVWPNY